MTTAIVIILAVLLDLWLGEPRQYHPLTGFGRLAQRIEESLMGLPDARQRLRGVLALALAVLLWVLLAWLLSLWPGVDLLTGTLLLYLAIAGSSLAQHGRLVAEALAAGARAVRSGPHARRCWCRGGSPGAAGFRRTIGAADWRAGPAVPRARPAGAGVRSCRGGRSGRRATGGGEE